MLPASVHASYSEPIFTHEFAPMRKAAKRRPADVQDRLIEGALRDAGRPVSAYELIDQLRDEVVLAPQTVYRSLGRLIAEGHAHRLESINAFVACRHHKHDEGTAVFAICEACGAVNEFACAEAVGALGSWATAARFRVDRMTLEIRGTCAACATA